MREYLSLEGESFLVGVFLAVSVEDALLLLYGPVAGPHYLVDPLDGPLDRRVEVVLYVVVPAPAEPGGLQQLADLAPLVAVLAEEGEKELVLVGRPLCAVA